MASLPSVVPARAARGGPAPLARATGPSPLPLAGRSRQVFARQKAPGSAGARVRLPRRTYAAPDDEAPAVSTLPGARARGTLGEPEPEGTALADMAPEVRAGVEGSQRNLVLLCALVALICAVDRAAMSVAILPMTEEFGWSDATKGAISSAFFLGYTVTNPIAGTAASSGSAKAILTVGVVVWSAFTMLTPAAAASGSVAVLLACRLVMGFGEGVTFPTIQAMMAAWIPSSSRSRALASTYAGAQAGTIVSLVTAPLLIQSFGWPSLFAVYGGAGFLWLAGWLPLVRDDPPVRIRGTRDPSSEKLDLLDLPWRDILTNGPFIALLTAHMTWAVGHYTILAWLPSFYSQEYGLDTASSATYSILPWVCTFFCTNLGGWVADGLINRGALTIGQTRKLMNSVAFLAPAAALVGLGASGAETPETALAFMTAALALGGFSGAGYASNHQDISSRIAPLLFGITNGSSSIAGTVAVYYTGVLRDQGETWGEVWGVVAGVYVVGALVYLALGSGERQFD